MSRKGTFFVGKNLEHVFYKGKKYRIQSSGKYYYRNQEEHLLHRTVWIDHYGAIPKGFVIHHKDHNWRNNDISNLEMVDRSSHGREHGIEGTKARKYKDVACFVCGKIFSSWLARFCSEPCYGKDYRRRKKENM